MEAWTEYGDWAIGLAFLWGAIWGSFFNVVIQTIEAFKAFTPAFIISGTISSVHEAGPSVATTWVARGFSAGSSGLFARAALNLSGDCSALEKIALFGTEVAAPIVDKQGASKAVTQRAPLSVHVLFVRKVHRGASSRHAAPRGPCSKLKWW